MTTKAGIWTDETLRDFCVCDSGHANMNTVCRPCYTAAKAEATLAALEGKP